MDGRTPSLSPSDLYSRLGTESAPVLVDVRPPTEFAGDDCLIVGAVHRDPDQAELWLKRLPSGRPVVIYCSAGDGDSRRLTSILASAGMQAAYLERGIAGWKKLGLPTRKRIRGLSNQWVTREHPKIDRIACPWLVTRFVNPDAEFLYVPAEEVLTVAKNTGATPYDVKGVEFGHVGDRCSFDAFIRIFEIRDGALDHLAAIIRGADTSRPYLAPQCEGLLAIIRGLAANYPDDHEMLRHGIIVYDALYAWCRGAQSGVGDTARPVQQSKTETAGAGK